MQKITILTVDDHDIVLRGLRQIMQESLSELRLDIHCARNGREALSLAANFPVALCIVDVELPDIEGTSLIKSLRAIRPDVKILINTIHEEIWYVRNYLKEKVDGIMFKTADGTEIAEGIRTVLGGNRYYCPRAKAIVNIIEQTELPTPKELEVLNLLATGLSSEEIANKMGISTNTVESHRRHLLTKLKARNSAELIMKAVTNGLLVHH